MKNPELTDQQLDQLSRLVVGVDRILALEEVQQRRYSIEITREIRSIKQNMQIWSKQLLPWATDVQHYLISYQKKELEKILNA